MFCGYWSVSYLLDWARVRHQKKPLAKKFLGLLLLFENIVKTVDKIDKRKLAPRTRPHCPDLMRDLEFTIMTNICI
jgi:hypothetical protein